ncbi:MAG: ATP-dependent zinc metalloprotease FtsH [Sedimentisphaeraceae bacterium JB056]
MNENNDQNQRNNKRMPKVPPLAGKGKPRGPFGWIIIAIIVISLFSMKDKFMPAEQITISQFKNFIDLGYVSSVEIGISSSNITGKFSEAGITARNQQNGSALASFKTQCIPEVVPDLTKKLDDNNVSYKFVGDGTFWLILINLAPFLFVILIFWFIFARNMKGGPGGMLMNFGRSKAKLFNTEDKKVTFDDVAGIEEAKDEVSEIIEFLKNPKRFMKIGGRIPRGLLLEGPPGCGKTLLARAIAGQADVPFFSISGSDFVEMFVGVGASRVRDLFKQAKENSPCIIFLDEVDAIGKKRGPGVTSGGHDEREQTLNAILVEMDGFESSDQVIVIAATNRADVLDKALTRPGRFDRQVFVPLPDIKGRAEILKVHAKKVKLSPDVNLDIIARGTPMFSGAELESLINEAAIAATMADKDFIEQADLEEARDKVRWGRAKKSRAIDQKEKELTAYHEAGHTLIQALLDDADPLHKVSIIPRGPMGGATFSLPEKDRYTYSQNFCKAYLQVCFGGRIAEEIFCGDITSGASADIKQATAMAKTMVLSWGMSDKLGLIDFVGDNPYKEMGLASGNEYSEQTSQSIDQEIKRLLDNAYDNAKALVNKHKDKVEQIAMALIKYETLDAEEVRMILDGEEIDRPTVAELLQAEQEKAAKAAEEEKQRLEAVKKVVEAVDSDEKLPPSGSDEDQGQKSEESQNEDDQSESPKQQ